MGNGVGQTTMSNVGGSQRFNGKGYVRFSKGSVLAFSKGCMSCLHNLAIHRTSGVRYNAGWVRASGWGNAAGVQVCPCPPSCSHLGTNKKKQGRLGSNGGRTVITGKQWEGWPGMVGWHEVWQRPSLPAQEEEEGGWGSCSRLGWQAIGQGVKKPCWHGPRIGSCPTDTARSLELGITTPVMKRQAG